MRASTARLMNSPVRLADLTFPQVSRLIHRTRLAFIHLDNLLAFAKRDRDGRVDGYITAHLPDECLLLFFRKGEAVNAASLPPFLKADVVAVVRAQSAVEQQHVLLQPFQRLFHYWHIFHLPLPVVMFVVLGVHIAVAVMLGYTWIF